MDNQWTDYAEDELFMCDQLELIRCQFGRKVSKMIGDIRMNAFTRLVLPHIGLVLFIVLYCLLGAYIFYRLEHPSEELRTTVAKEYLQGNISQFLLFIDQRHKYPNGTYSDLRTVEARLLDLLRTYENLTSKCSITLDHLTRSEYGNSRHWSYASSILFAFTIITTIGYGNLAPVTFNGRLFCMFYGLIGIPATMVAIANVGQFLAEGVELLFNGFRRRVKQLLCVTTVGSETQEVVEEEEPQTAVGAILVCLTFVGYILVGAMCLPIWEEFDFFGGCYFAFVTITTVGLGDIVPEKLEYLFPTIVYITLGLAVTTLTIEVMSQYLRQMHYVGSEVKDTKDVYVWFGNKMLTVGELVGVIGDQYGIPKGEIQDLKKNFDSVVVHSVEEKAAKKKVGGAAKGKTKKKSNVSRAPLFDGLEFRYIDEESLLDLPHTTL